MNRCLDLFTGAGGLHLATASCGLETIAFAEVDPYASRVLAQRYPHIPNLGDVTKIAQFPAAEFIVGGFPCQDISLASPTQVGLRGKRSGLWSEMRRAIEQLRPRGVLIENSDQLVRKGLDIVLQDLATLGYDAEWYTVSASSIGAPHRRNRCAVIAYRIGSRGIGLGAPLHLEYSGQWLWAGAADLRDIAESPFVAGTRWPQPLLRRMDDGLADRSHRLRAIGNGVVVPLFAQLVQRMMECSR